MHLLRPRPVLHSSCKCHSCCLIRQRVSKDRPRFVAGAPLRERVKVLDASRPARLKMENNMMVEAPSGIWRRCVWSLMTLSLSIAIGEQASVAQAGEETSGSGEELAQPKAVELEDMLVSVERITPVSGASTALVTDEQIRASQARDVTEVLKSRVSGVTGKRSGGINLDPAIRGLREDRLSVMTNGTKIWGGGPFRMDPPTSLLDVDELEAIEVIKGPYSVTRGPSSIGGTINLLTKKPELSPHWDMHGSLGAAYTSNYNGFTTKASVSAGGPALAFRLAGSYRDYQDYDSGDGEHIQSGFQSQSVSGTLLWQPHADHRFFLSMSREADRDTRFAALPLNMEEDDAYLGSVSYTITSPLPFVESLQFSGYYNYVHHRMNNDHKPHRAGSGAGMWDGSGPGMQDTSGHPAGQRNGGHDPHGHRAEHGQNGDMAGHGQSDRRSEGHHMTGTGHGDMILAGHGEHAGPAHPVRRSVFPLDARTFGGRVQANMLPGLGGRLSLGGDVYRLEREGTHHLSFLSGDMAGTTRYFHAWPETHIMDGGIFGEYVYLPAPKWRLIVGARVDFVDAGANPGPTERMQYHTYYGASADDIGAFETNVSANARLIYSPVSSLDLFVGVGRAARTADATERYLALGPGPGGFYIGNPGLDPEESFEVDTGIQARWGRLAVGGVLFYNRIEDYILQYILDRAFQCPHGPCNLRGFRNINHAALLGAELDLSYVLRENLSLHGSFAYVHGENEEDDRALPEIPPLEGRVGLRYEHPHWGLWCNPMLRLVQSQHRIDTAFGEDTTQGHVTADISAGWRLFGRHELMVHVENLLDKNYNEHITRENPFTGREVFEPGRVVTVGLRTTF